MKRRTHLIGHPPRMRRRRRAAAARDWRPRAGELDLWRVALDGVDAAGVERLRALLSADEEERAAGFYFDRDRRRFIVARGALRTILAAYLGLPAAEIALAYGLNGKPRLADRHGQAPLAFNVAHSDELALVAVVRRGEIGVDVEHVRDLPDWEAIASSYFSPVEQDRLRAAAVDERPIEFFRAWTRQEAVLKASGIGLGGLDERGPERRGHGDHSAAPVAAAATVRVVPFSPAAAHVAAVAVAPDVNAVRCWEWTADAASRARPLRRGRSEPLPQLAQFEPKFL